MERVEKIDHVAGVVVNALRRRILGAIVELSQLRRDHVPAARRHGMLRFPHACVQWKGVKQGERSPRPDTRARNGFEVPETAD
jgi:hypothetical protein